MKLESNIMFALCALFFVSCDSEKIDQSIISSGAVMSQEAREIEQNLDKASYAELSDFFLDNNNISFDKDVFLIFGKNNCPYCDILKDELKNNGALKNEIKEHFNPYYINVSYSKTHNISWENKESKIETLNFSSLFNSSATPTLVFLNKNGEVKFIYPGYTPGFKELISEVVKSDKNLGDYSAINAKIKAL